MDNGVTFVTQCQSAHPSFLVHQVTAETAAKGLLSG